MLVKVKRGWEIPESEATPESVFYNRRALLKAMGMGAILAAGSRQLRRSPRRAADAAEPDPSAGLYPAKRNDTYTLDRPITDEKLSTNYNNFYEYGEDKDICRRRPAIEDPALDD